MNSKLNDFSEKLKKALEESQVGEKGKVVVQKSGSPFMFLTVLLALAKLTVAPSMGWGVVFLPIWLPLALGLSIIFAVLALLLIVALIAAAIR